MKIKVIAEFPTPSSITQLERFIGMVNFYHIFVPKAAEMMKPLYQALTGKPQPKTLTWLQEMDRAFQAAKDALSEAGLLHHHVSGARTALTTDASDTAIGAVLEQQIGDHWQPLAFYSRQLSKTEFVGYHRPRVTGHFLRNPPFSILPGRLLIHSFY